MSRTIFLSWLATGFFSLLPFVISMWRWGLVLLPSVLSVLTGSALFFILLRNKFAEHRVLVPWIAVLLSIETYNFLSYVIHNIDEPLKWWTYFVKWGYLWMLPEVQLPYFLSEFTIHATITLVSSIIAHQVTTRLQDLFVQKRSPSSFFVCDFAV